MRALVTGGAGFIGSHLVDRLTAEGHTVRVLDDLSTGSEQNLSDPVELVVGDVADPGVLAGAMDGIEVVFHEAAIGSVARSIDDPVGTDRVNVTGTLEVLVAARTAGVRRVVAASSCSVYGDATALPLDETVLPSPRSPYAVTKLTLEHYCRVFADLGVETVALRYFNVFGPRQPPGGAYAAVVPAFLEALARGDRPTVYGDGRQTRDFVFVGDVVTANLLAAAAPADRAVGRVLNVGRGESHAVLDVLEAIADALGVEARWDEEPARPGEVRDSRADVSAAADAIGFRSTTTLDEGIRTTVAATRT